MSEQGATYIKLEESKFKCLHILFFPFNLPPQYLIIFSFKYLYLGECFVS